MTQARNELLHEGITEAVIGAAIEVHKTLGPGLLESAYEACLIHELIARGLSVASQVELPVDYKGNRVDCAFRIDIVVEGQVLIELKSVEKVLPIHEAQLLTYMKLSGIRVGLLINFNARTLRDGLIRRVL